MTETVEKCRECPFFVADSEWCDAECFYTPESEIKRWLEGDRQCSQHPELNFQQETPPSWCPLRTGDITVTLAPALANKES